MREKWSQTSPSALAEEVLDWCLRKEPFQSIGGPAYFGGKGWALQLFAASGIRFVAVANVVEGNLCVDFAAGRSLFAGVVVA